MANISEVIANAPDNFVIQNAIEKCFDIIDSHNKIMIAVSGGGDSDVMLDLLIKCGAKEKATFVFFDTGLEYQATKDHIKNLEEKYSIEILTHKPKKPIPISVKEKGVPFWSKYVSEMLYRLQMHGFKFEDEPFEVLIERYPRCKTALEWWCGHSEGTTMFSIERAPYMKEFLIQNPPTFPISAMCCQHAKKDPSHQFQKLGNFDLVCLGIRKSEGGVRSVAYKSCFDEKSDGEADVFRPIFYLRDVDKEEYCDYYGVTHSKCYSEYGLLRTGCFGCPFGKRFEEELSAMEQFEPKLVKAANAIFGKGYEYTRQYLKFRDEMKRK